MGAGLSHLSMANFGADSRSGPTTAAQSAMKYASSPQAAASAAQYEIAYRVGDLVLELQEARALQSAADYQPPKLATPAKPSFAKLNPVFEGCCQGNRQTCKCGAPFFS